MFRRIRTSTILVSLLVVALALGLTGPEGSSQSGSAGIDSLLPGPVAGKPSTLTIRAIDGGTKYYERFRNGLPDDPTYFPVGVWFESVLTSEDVSLNSRIGINTYVNLTDDSNLKLIQDLKLHSISSFPSPFMSGFQLSDEADMWAGPGYGAWTGNYAGDGPVCAPASDKCGYSVQKIQGKLVGSDVMTYSNYGKGVAFWESSIEAATFVNDFQDVVSADTYWFTDPNICGRSEGGTMLGAVRDLSSLECRRAANYGWTVERLRQLQDARKPVWAFVEVGQPFVDSDTGPISGPEIRAAVWSSIIHGARGIIYFNHNFGGTCISQHVLRDPCGNAVRPDVTALNTQISSLAEVLNAPFVDGLASHGPGLDVAVKAHGDSLYVFAAATVEHLGDMAIKFGCHILGKAEVLGEKRTVTLEGDTLKDTFDDANAVHIYRLRGGCE